MSNRRTLLNRRQFGALVTGAYLTSVCAGDERNRHKEVSWLADVQQPLLANNNDGLNLASIMPPAATLEDWLERRKQLRQSWLTFLGSIKRPNTPPATKVIAEDRVGSVVRQLIGYESEPGWPTEAYVLRPAADATRLLPGVVVFHSTWRIRFANPPESKGISRRHLVWNWRSAAL